jgi:cellobiose phosphorylase
MTSYQTLYGYFDGANREYIITRPDTPQPWINVISNGDYGMILSQSGSGYSWRTHASLNRITRWEQDLIRDEWGKFIYLRDAQTGEFWSPSWQPRGHALESYRVRHGMGYSVVEATKDTIESGVTYFVPVDEPCEIWLLRLQNHGAETRQLQVFTYFEWLLGTAPDWHREFRNLFLETRYDPEHGVILATNVMWDIPGERGPHWNRGWPYVAFHSASQQPSGYDCSKRAFLGRHGNPSDPIALRQGASQGTQGRWADAIGGLQLGLELPPGEVVELNFILGAASSESQALALASRYKDKIAAGEALSKVQHFWQDLNRGLVVETPDQAIDPMANGWLAYQAISGRLWGRTAYYQMGGAYGFRDQLQDSLVWLLLGRPENTLAQIRLHAAHQYQDGIVLHWWHPLAEEGLRSEYSDDLLWLPYVVLQYIYETGDYACLDEDLPYYDHGSAPLRQHCMRAFEVALGRRSPRGLPLILKGDWNDGLNAVGAGGRGESIWMAHFLYFLLTRWADLPVLDADTRTRFRVEADALHQATDINGWDGAWYWRATKDNGNCIGSAQNKEGQIFLNAQTWAVLSGLAAPDRASQAMQSARKYLYSPYGPLLLAPAYTLPDPEIGYLTRYAPGLRENGGVYVHAACWAVLAERKLHGVQAAYDLWRSFCPAVRGQEPDAYMAEPYVMPGNIDGPLSISPGRGGWSWYTGSAAWYLRALIEGVLGIEATLHGLCVQAALPAGWNGYRVKRHYRGADYDIHVRRADSGEPAGCKIDGQSWQGDILPLLEPGSAHQVEYRCD